MSQVLVADKRYQGQYVAFDSQKGKEVVAFGGQLFFLWLLGLAVSFFAAV